MRKLDEGLRVDTFSRSETEDGPAGAACVGSDVWNKCLETWEELSLEWVLIKSAEKRNDYEM